MTCHELTIAECRTQALHYLETSKLNMFLIDEYIENDNADTIGFEQYELCRSILFDSLYKERLFYQEANRSDNWFRRIEDQIYKLLTHDDKYASDPIYIHMILSGIVSGLINFLVDNFSIDAATAGGIAYFLVYTITKIGLNTWRQKYEDDRELNDEGK